MGKARVGIVVGSLGLAIFACSSSTVPSGGNGGGSNPAGCPALQPTGGISCSPSGMSCSYGCATTAMCSQGAWSIEQSNISCPGDGGGLPLVDGGNQDGGGNQEDGPANCIFDKDCPPSLACRPSECNACVTPQSPCTTDNDCASDASAPMVCSPGNPCTCAVNGKSGSCVPACQSAGSVGCSPVETCDTGSGHCVLKPCKIDMDCPETNEIVYACSGSGTCAAKTCMTSADCPGQGHACINGICSGGVGECAPRSQ